MLNLIKMIEYVHSFLLLNIARNYLLYLLQIQKIFGATNVVMDSAILNQLNNLEKEVDSDVTKSKEDAKGKLTLK